MAFQVELDDRLAARLDSLVASRGFASREEGLEWAIEQLYERTKRLQEIEAQLEEGLADVDAGRMYTAQQVRDRLRQPQRA